MHKETISEIGEKELIRRIAKFMAKNQTSDDCAFLDLKQTNLLINTDLMVENTHFDSKILCPRDIGWKAVVTNFSDLVSSGCDEIIGINVGLVINENTHWEWVNNVYKGISEALSTYGGSILGGDCSRGNNKMLSITAFGYQGELKLRRNECKPGEILLTSGIHGLSKLGFLLQKNHISKNDSNLNQSLINDSIEAFCRPEPQFKTLKEILIAGQKNAKFSLGCTDSSDGFYQAILDLATESKCKAIIDYQKIPKRNDWPSSSEWDEIYLFGGEDYKLLFSLPEQWAKKLLKQDQSITEIGYFKEGVSSVEFINLPENKIINNNSFSHF